MSADMKTLQEKLGYNFQKSCWLTRALTHSSAAETRRKSYERLEFLGDRVLGLVLATMLVEAFPDENEGELGYRFTALAQRDALVRVAQHIGIPELLVLSEGEKSSGGRDNPGLAADAMEAVIAAIYLDGGLEPAEHFIRSYWTKLILENARPPKDAKTRLQEWAQARGYPLPAYETVERTGPDHQPEFTVAVTVRDWPQASGRGGNKRAAEQSAAEAMLELIAAARASAK